MGGLLFVTNAGMFNIAHVYMAVLHVHGSATWHAQNAAPCDRAILEVEGVSMVVGMPVEFTGILKTLLISPTGGPL